MKCAECFYCYAKEEDTYAHCQFESGYGLAPCEYDDPYEGEDYDDYCED